MAVLQLEQTGLAPPVLTVPSGQDREHFVSPEAESVYWTKPVLQVVQESEVRLGHTEHPLTTQFMLQVL